MLIKEYVDDEFEWDDRKERKNIKKHGIDFRTASRVFLDEYLTEIYDGNYDGEDRWDVIGEVDKVLFVVYTVRGSRYRIISARKAVDFERRLYYGNRNL